MQNLLAVCPGFFIGANEMTAVAKRSTHKYSKAKAASATGVTQQALSIWIQKRITDARRAAGLPIRESLDYRAYVSCGNVEGMDLTTRAVKTEPQLRKLDSTP